MIIFFYYLDLFGVGGGLVFVLLQIKRLNNDAVCSSSIINGLASVETEDILTPADSRTRKNHSFKFKHLQANCDSYRLTCAWQYFGTLIFVNDPLGDDGLFPLGIVRRLK